MGKDRFTEDYYTKNPETMQPDIEKFTFLTQKRKNPDPVSMVESQYTLKNRQVDDIVNNKKEKE